MPSLRLYSMLLGAGVAAAVAVVTWVRSHRKTAVERERERRERVNVIGRITDGTVLDVCVLDTEIAQPSQLIAYNYDVAGVQYECSQDVTHLQHLFDVQSCKLGLPASVKYDPQNPGNSIVIAENWSGLRM
ncbi:MAG TPA: hypothetical protein VMU24_13195 [Candidatus Acidoferrales bacterium]|nr:hypothetical protein [Candidatus Acidoferrales bacterium]